MKKLALLIGCISTFSLVACSQPDNSKKVDYSSFYQKIQKIEENHDSHATLFLKYSDELSGDGKTRIAIQYYSWSEEQKLFARDGIYEFDLTYEINITIKDRFTNSEESQDQIDLGTEYFIEPFKTYIDYTETIEERTIRFIESCTYNSYGYITDYLRQVTINGTFNGMTVNGTSKMEFSILYY